MAPTDPLPERRSNGARDAPRRDGKTVSGGLFGAERYVRPLNTKQETFPAGNMGTMSAEGRANEVGRAAPRGRPPVDQGDAERMLSSLARETISLGPNIIVSGLPETCPACEASDVMWGCDPDQGRTREEIHPLVWHEMQRMADSFVCRSCWAGWIEPDGPQPITWVRPYWRLGESS